MTSDFAQQAFGFLGRVGSGSRIAGYLIEEQIGAGGMPVVFRAWVRQEMTAPQVSQSPLALAALPTAFLTTLAAISAGITCYLLSRRGRGMSAVNH